MALSPNGGSDGHTDHRGAEACGAAGDDVRRRMEAGSFLQ
jgi:hypothetical protein